MKRVRPIVLALCTGFGVACATQHPGGGMSPRDTVHVVDTVTVAGRADAQMEQRSASLQLRLLEQNAVNDDLQGRLDDAMREVVRAMAKLQSLATRAEAASAMAEADVATRQLKTAGNPGEAARAQKLLDLSNAEFQAQNYGGAVYLANQAKGVVNASGAAGGPAHDLKPGEVAFAIPVPIEASARGNVREGPGTTFKVAFAVEAGARLTAQSYLENWVRVQDDGGRSGWIFNTLIRAPKH
ncbi:MAG TPA: SH3 domain-containing protein [Gemmatimonadales bacterium]